MRCRRAFTLVEVVVVVAIIAMLIAICLPMVTHAKEQALATVCLTRQSQLSGAVHSYAVSNTRRIPYGPVARPGSLVNFYPITGSVTTLLTLEDTAPVGLGLLFGGYMSQNPEAVFCPAPDQPSAASLHAGLVGSAQAQGSFIYRHGSSYYFEPPRQMRLQIDNLGLNRFGSPVRALAVDSNLITGPGLALFGITSRTHHRQRYANVMYADGHCRTFRNIGQADVDISTLPVPMLALERMLMVLEWADAE